MKWFITFVTVFYYLNGFSQEENKAFLEAKANYSSFTNKHSHFIETANTRLYYLRWGEAKNPAVLWLHGSYSNGIEIEPFAEKLVAQGYQLIAIDYYGHGQTAIPEKSFSTQNFFEDINTLLHSLSIRDCILGGFSRGAYLAAMYYHDSPQKVKALILEDGGISPFLEHFSKLSDKELTKTIQQEIQNRPQELFLEYETEEEAYSAIAPYGETDINQLYKNFSFIRHENNKFRIYKDTDSLYGINSINNIRLLLQGQLTSNPFANDMMIFSFFQKIKEIHIPILLLEAKSEADPFPKSNYYLELAKSKQNITHNVFTQSNHTIHFEQPEDFIKSIINFLEKLSK